MQRIVWALLPFILFGSSILQSVAAGANTSNVSDIYDIEPALSPSGDKIVFVSSREGSRDIWIMSSDGREKANLTSAFNKTLEFTPRWSFDGEYIGFMSIDEQDHSDIWIFSVMTGEARNITENIDDNAGQFSWSPNDLQIAFGVGDFLSQANIWITDIATQEMTMLTQTGVNTHPVWSSDGESISFFSGRTDIEVRLFNLADSTSSTLLDTEIGEYIWSPISNRIALTLKRPSIPIMFDVAIYQSGLDPSILTSGVEYIYVHSVAWSPDEQNLSFIAECASSSALFYISLDNLKLTDLTGCQNGRNAFPSWFPDGSRILFQSDRSGNNSIWTMNVGGTSATNLSDV